MRRSCKYPGNRLRGILSRQVNSIFVSDGSGARIRTLPLSPRRARAPWRPLSPPPGPSPCSATGRARRSGLHGSMRRIVRRLPGLESGDRSTGKADGIDCLFCVPCALSTTIKIQNKETPKGWTLNKKGAKISMILEDSGTGDTGIGKHPSAASGSQILCFPSVPRVPCS